LLNCAQVEELYVNSGETVTSLNVKRGILGLLQAQTKTGKRSEVFSSSIFTLYSVNW